jgi:hypothetical protein
MSSIITTVVTAASEAEYASTFLTGCIAYPLRQTLEEMGWPQLPTNITTDNKTACGIANRTTKMKRSKAMDMRWHWIRDKVDQGEFTVHWRAGKHSVADFLTKAHPSSHCREQRYLYVLPTEPHLVHHDKLEEPHLAPC